MEAAARPDLARTALWRTSTTCSRACLGLKESAHLDKSNQVFGHSSRLGADERGGPSGHPRKEWLRLVSHLYPVQNEDKGKI